MANRARVRTQSGLDSLPLPDTTPASTSNTAGTGGNKESSLRRISEQKHLRSFLSVHFNRQEFVKATISGGATDSVFNDLSSAIVDVKEEIQSYITMNKDSLIHGMSNVTVLADKYQLLSSKSAALHKTVTRLRTSALDSHISVSTKVKELGRIHATNSLLRQLRQYVTCMAHLRHLLSAVNQSSEGGPDVGGNASGDTHDHSSIHTTTTTTTTTDNNNNNGGGGGDDDPLTLDENVDIRQMATIAKVVNELETLLYGPPSTAKSSNVDDEKVHTHNTCTLMNITTVKQNKHHVSAFGNRLRSLAQNRLFAALIEKDQVSIAACLQVFFNLNSLLEILMVCIDWCINRTGDVTRRFLLDSTFLNRYPELLGSKGAASNRARGHTSTHTSLGSNRSHHQNSDHTNLKHALQEASSVWADQVSEQARIIAVLQRVLLKKEDPSSHKLFSIVLLSHQHRSAQTLSKDMLNADKDDTDAKNSHSSNSYLHYLYRSQLLACFWERMSTTMHDVISEKVRLYPIACNRIYPYLRKAAVHVVNTINSTSQSESYRDRLLGGLVGLPNGITGSGIPGSGSLEVLPEEGENDTFGTASLSFHSLLPNLVLGSDQHNLYNPRLPTMSSNVNSREDESASAGGYSGVTTITNPSSSSALSMLHIVKDMNRNHSNKNDSHSPSSSSSSSSSIALEVVDPSYEDGFLVASLKAMKDRYLITVLNRLNNPIQMMFPSLEGYTAAIPSHRDIQEFTKVLTNELQLVCVESESEIGLVYAIAREAMKSITLLINNVEDMILNDVESLNMIQNSSQQQLHQIMCTLTSKATAAMTQVSHQGGQQKAPNNKRGSQESIGESLFEFTCGSGYDHNMQLIQLLAHFRAYMTSLPDDLLLYVHKQGKGADPADDTPILEEGGDRGDGSGYKGGMHAILTSLSYRCNTMIDELLSKQLLLPMVESVSDYITSLLCHLPFESSSTSSTVHMNSTESDSRVDEDSMLLTGSSSSIRAVFYAIKGIYQTYFLSSKSADPGSLSLYRQCMDEIMLKVIAAYISIASLIRPINEKTRVRIAKDMSVLEQLCSDYTPLLLESNKASKGVSAPGRESLVCPVMREFTAFRKFIFEQNSNSTSAVSPQKGVSTSGSEAVVDLPTLDTLLQLSYIHDLRPSTVLQYIISAAPAQLPSSFERYEANDSNSNHASNSAGRGDSRVDKLYTYITALLKVPTDNVAGILPSVRSLYHIKMNFDDPCIIIVDHVIISAALGGYAFGSNKGADPGNTSTPLMIGSAMGPRGILNENRVAWKSVQSSIDIFLQRISVSDGSKRIAMRHWADCVIDVGNYYFGAR